MNITIIGLPMNFGNGKGRNFNVADENARRLKHILGELTRYDTTPWENIIIEITETYGINETVFTGQYHELGCVLAEELAKENYGSVIRSKDYWQWWQSHVSYSHIVSADTINETTTNNKYHYFLDVLCSMLLDDDLHQSYYKNFVSYKASGSYFKQIHNQIQNIFSDESTSKSKGNLR